MATITIKTDKYTDVLLEHLEKLHCNWRIKRNTIIKAAIQAFYVMSEEDKEKYLNQASGNDKRRRVHYTW